MREGDWLLFGFLGTVILTTLMAASQGLGLTRMNLPYILGTIFTPHRERAKVIGFFVHLLNGWIFSLVYVAGFVALGGATIWLGALFGVIHAAFVLVVGLGLLPGLHPRMASERQGPTVTRQLEPPGFCGLNYGRRTPLSVVASHVVYGALLGALYGHG